MAGIFVPRWLLIAMAALLAAPLYALEVEQTLWGFDGRVVPDHFNPFSVLVSNPGNLAFDGALSLVLNGSGPGGNASLRGASYVQPIFLAPHTSRWVQFSVPGTHSAGPSELRWGRGAKEFSDVDGPLSTGPPSCVWLRDLDSPFTAGGSLKSFPDQLFPTSAVAAESLDAVVLDHVPHWEPARRDAFLDWVRLGGTLHLVPDTNGALPAFGGDLKELDAQDEVTRVGAGRVVHHAIALREMSEQYLTAHGYPARTLENVKGPILYDMESTFFRDLSSLTRPKVSWTLINLVMIAYVAVVGPMHNYFRRRIDYRVSILIFLGCVAAFGAALGIIGRRGYGESQTVHSLGIARALGGGRVDVTQWISAFATAGDRYTLTHRAPANLYASDRFAETGSGLIFNGKDGYMLMDIPLYSARAFTHRAIMTGDDTSVTVEKWGSDSYGSDFRTPGTLHDLRLRTGPGFPQHARAIHAVYKDTIFELELHDGVLTRNSRTGEALSSYFSRDKLNAASYQDFSSRTTTPHTADTLSVLLPALAARTLNYPAVFPTHISAPKNRAEMQLLILAPAPPSLQLQGKGFAHEDGWVLYVQDVSKP
ncbi:MAG: hypothetical protein ABJF10_00750 [Chthoniobacter sp.]|uniref:hypothetical protein n=1 Tax=Chthoniobacter sp. TaxID=2510640 RepID=UPI0032A62971